MFYYILPKKYTNLYTQVTFSQWAHTILQPNTTY